MASVSEPNRLMRGASLPTPIAHPDVSIVASTISAGWSDVQAWIVECRLADFYHHSSRLHAGAFLLSGTTQVEWTRGGRFTRYPSEPGSLTIIPAGDDHHFRTDRRIRALVWMIDPGWLQSVADQEWGPHESMVKVLEAFNH